MSQATLLDPRQFLARKSFIELYAASALRLCSMKAPFENCLGLSSASNHPGS